LVPRLLAAGADLRRVHFVQLMRDGLDQGLTLPDDVGELSGAIESTGARLVVVDPIMGHLATELDSHKDHSIRRALAPLARLAEERDCAVVPIAHLNKAPTGDIFGRVGGSIGLTAAARSILLMTADPEREDDDAARLMSHGKSNLGPLAPALRVRVAVRAVAGADGKDILTAAVEPGEEAPHIKVHDVLAPPLTEDTRR
jgi:hypothetical protein